MQLALNIVAVVLGLGAGFSAGWGIGRRFEKERRTLWTLGVTAFALAWAVDLAGFWLGLPQVSIGSIALMAGLLTGIKYGGFPAVRVWEPQEAEDDDRPLEAEEAVGDDALAPPAHAEVPSEAREGARGPAAR